MRRFYPLAHVILALACIAPLGACGDHEQVSYDACPIPLGDSPSRGPDDAWVTIVEFADFECPYCQEVEATIKAVDEERPGLRWVYKYFPIPEIHPNATMAASAADCAAQQGKFWEMHDKLYSVPELPKHEAALENYAEQLGLDQAAWSECFNSNGSLDRIVTDVTQGRAYGVGGTPAFFINGVLLPGAYPLEDFLSVIKAEQAKAKASGVPRAAYYESIVSQGCHG